MTMYREDRRRFLRQCYCTRHRAAPHITSHYNLEKCYYYLRDVYRWDLLSFIRKKFSSLSFPLLFFFFLERDRMRISTGQLSASSSDRAGKVWWQVSMIRDDPWSINEKDGGGKRGEGGTLIRSRGKFRQSHSVVRMHFVLGHKTNWIGF